MSNKLWSRWFPSIKMISWNGILNNSIIIYILSQVSVTVAAVGQPLHKIEHKSTRTSKTNRNKCLFAFSQSIKSLFLLKQWLFPVSIGRPAAPQKPQQQQQHRILCAFSLGDVKRTWQNTINIIRNTKFPRLEYRIHSIELFPQSGWS